MTVTASKRAVLAARELLETEPQSFSLPLGLVDTAKADQLLTLAALLVVWVQKRERCTAEAALGLLGHDYVFDAILSAAADREEVKS